MAVVALASASGSPGTTSAALGLTLMWPRPVLLLEADPSHGSSVLAGYLRGAVAPRGASLLGLVKAHRLGDLASAVDAETVALDSDGQRRLIPALPSPEQAPVLEPVWNAMAEVFADLDEDGVDVIVDAGRLGTAHGPDPLLRIADVVAILTRTHLPAVAAAHARVTSMAALRESQGRSPAQLFVVGEGRPYTAAEIAEVTGLSVLASLAWDPVAADVLSLGTPRPRRWEQGRLVRSLVVAADEITEQITQPQAHKTVGAASVRARWARG